MEPHSWLKCRPRLSPQLIKPSNYNPLALVTSMLITTACRASWIIASKHPANVEQLARVFSIHLLDVCLLDPVNEVLL